MEMLTTLIISLANNDVFCRTRAHMWGGSWGINLMYGQGFKIHLRVEKKEVNVTSNQFVRGSI